MKSLYICFLFTFAFSVDCQTSNYRTAVSSELINLLESVYCSDKMDLTVCNSAEGKVCINARCVSACSAGKLSPCTCPQENHCSLCCGSATNSCKISISYSIFESNGLQWTRQNSLDSCGPIVRASNPVCPTSQNGKICDLILKSSVSVEEPRVCNNGQCVQLMCNSLFMPGQVGRTIVACECRDGYRNYPVCCTDLNNATCLPFQMWLRAPQGRGYMDAIGVRQAVVLPGTTVSPIILRSTTVTNIPQEIDKVECTSSGSEEMKCGNMQWCIEGQCQHVCGQPDRECWCEPESGTECHICCMNDKNKCLSVNQNLSNPVFVKQFGQPCDYAHGRCMLNGTCEIVSKLDMEVAFCRQQQNDGKICDSETYSVCRNSMCVHVCGRPDNMCICQPDSNHECQICCRNGSGHCDVATTAKLPFIARYHSVPCDVGYGICNDQGVCEVLPNYCLLSASHNHKKCGADRKCTDQKCVHVCGHPDNECVCTGGSYEECHVCCMDNKGDCHSANVNITEPKDHFVRPKGTYCNFTLGTCSSFGECESMNKNPLTVKFCQKPQNDGYSCDSQEGFICDNYTCVNACEDLEDFCICSSSSNEECHICCRNQTNNGCTSIVSESELKRRFRTAGTPCHSGQGTCDHNGMCNLLPTSCSDRVNEHKKCGDQSLCLVGECEPICGENEECICPSDDDDDDECKICCFNETLWSCSPAAIPHVHPHLLARPLNTPCKKGTSSGYCTYNGTCAINHNLMDTKPKGCRACRFEDNFVIEILFLFACIFIFN